MPYSAAEKFKFGENPKEVIVRGIKEELGIDISEDQFSFYNKTKVEVNDDYPDIRSFHHGHEFLVVLTKDQFKEDGYVEEQDDKTVFFVWKRMKS